MIIDLFGGPGGWSEGLRALLGLTDVGIEWDAWACATRAAADHPTIRADVASWPAGNIYGRLEGLICSSPCPDFSKAGKRAGPNGPTGRLVFETLRWAEEARPRWIAAENVPEVAPIFLSFRAPLAALGYSVWSGVLDAADYGVPQNRRRAFLLASLDRQASAPPPTHSSTGSPEMFGPGRERWVSMAEALPHLFPDAWSQRGDLALDTKAGRSNWKLRHPGRTYGTTTTTTTTEPAPCVALGHNVAEWCWERPATTVQGTPRIAPPGHHERQWNNAIAVELWELGVLQGFPPDYPWQGNKTARARQIGDAVPPPMAAAIVRALTS